MLEFINQVAIYSGICRGRHGFYLINPKKRNNIPAGWQFIKIGILKQLISLSTVKKCNEFTKLVLNGYYHDFKKIRNAHKI